MKGRAKLVRYSDGKYRVFIRNHFWQKWEQLKDDYGNEIICDSIKELSEKTRIDCFDMIIFSFDKFSGLGR